MSIGDSVDVHVGSPHTAQREVSRYDTPAKVEMRCRGIMSCLLFSVRGRTLVFAPDMVRHIPGKSQ